MTSAARVRFPEPELVHHTYTELVGEEIRLLCMRRHVSGKDLATVIGVSQVGVSRRMTGETPWDINELAAVAEAFGLPIAALLPPPSAAPVPAPRVRSRKAKLPHLDSNQEPAGQQVTGLRRGTTQNIRPTIVADEAPCPLPEAV